jgi:hypothetical protein
MIHQKILLTEEECNKLIEYKDKLKMTSTDGHYPSIPDINYTEWTFYRDDENEFIYERILPFIEEKFNVTLIEFNEMCHIYQYSINDGYVMHRDTGYDRRFTVGIQLCNNYEGGDLVVNYNGEKIVVSKEIGNCYVFDSKLLHGVLPIETGQRFNFLTFIKIKT